MSDADPARWAASARSATSRWPTEVALFALTAAAAFGFCRLFIGWSFLPPLLLAAAGSHLLAAACRRRGGTWLSPWSPRPPAWRCS